VPTPFAETPKAPNRIDEIAARIGNLPRSGWNDPKAWLKGAPLDALAAVLGTDDLNYVALEREKLYAARPPRPVPKPVAPPAPSRAEVTSNVLRLHAEGKSVDDISKALGTGRMLTQFIIDQQNGAS
jgi:hypothetical protein